MIPSNSTSLDRSFNPLRFKTLIYPNLLEILKRLQRQVSAKALPPIAEKRIKGRYIELLSTGHYLELVERVETLDIILKLILSMQSEYATVLILLSLLIFHGHLFIIEARMEIELQCLEFIPQDFNHFAYVSDYGFGHLQVLHIVVLVHFL